MQGQEVSTYDIASVNAILQGIKNSGMIIREIRSNDELVVRLQEALNNGKTTAFIPTSRTMRNYYNAQGFIACMKKVLVRLHNFRVLIEPNFYGSRLILALEPAYAETIDSSNAGAHAT